MTVQTFSVRRRPQQSRPSASALRTYRIDRVPGVMLIAGAVLILVVSRAFGHESATERTEASAAPAARIASVLNYNIPAVHLVRDDGKNVSLADEINDGRPVVLNFIFTSCSSICPLMSQTFAQFDRKLGSERSHVHLMSISVDPEEDTPARLREYAEKFHAGPEWQHYTGTIEASLATQRAFNVWRGDKMSHSPITFVRAAPGTPWLRIEGFVTPDELLQQYRHLLEPAGQTVATR